MLQGQKGAYHSTDVEPDVYEHFVLNEIELFARDLLFAAVDTVVQVVSVDIRVSIDNGNVAVEQVPASYAVLHELFIKQEVPLLTRKKKKHINDKMNCYTAKLIARRFVVATFRSKQAYNPLTAISADCIAKAVMGPTSIARYIESELHVLGDLGFAVNITENNESLWYLTTNMYR